MADSDENLEQLFAALQLTDEQKQTAESLLDVVQQIEQLERTIKAMTAPQRAAVMRYWVAPSLRHGLNVEFYRRSFSDLSQMLKCSAFDA